MKTIRPNIRYLATTLMVLAASIVQAEEPVTLDGAPFDFGLVAQNNTYEHRIWIRAAGEDTVMVGDIKTGCGCLSATPESRQILPGDSLPIVFYWQTRGLVGQQVVSAFVYARPGLRPIEVILSGKVVTPLDSAASIGWVPARIEFTTTGRRNLRNQAKVFGLTNNLETDLAVAVVSSGSGLQLSLPDSVRSGQVLTGRIGLAESFLDSTFESSVTLELTGNQEAKYRVSIPVVSGDFSFRPIFTTTKE